MSAYKVSPSELKKLQCLCLEMLIEFDRICRKNTINYSIEGGTLLGAVRHGGFIPWDDDVDVIMTREEYNKFALASKTNLDTSRFFLQDHNTDPEYRWGFEKLRRKNTVQVRLGQEHLKQYPGVFMDIFVVDNIPDSTLGRIIWEKLVFCIRKLQYSAVGARNEKHFIDRLWFSCLNMIPIRFSFWLRDTLAGYCNRKKTQNMGHYTFPYPHRCRYGMPAECFSEFVDIDFEGYTVRAFKEYDRYLSIYFGDYMTLPPVEERVSHVEYSDLQLIDVNVSLRSDK